MTVKKRKATRASWGKVRKLPSGRLQASYVGPDGDRHNAPMTFSAKGDAEVWLAGVRSTIAKGEWVSPEAVATARAAAETTLAEYAATWMQTNRNRKGEPLRPRTLAEYERLLRGPLATLTPLPLALVTAERVDAWYDEQSRTGKLTQASRAYSLLSTIMAHAVDRGRLGAGAVNPCRVRGAQSARTGKKVVPPTDAQLATILETIAPRFRALVHIAADAGLRWGEATELRRGDVTVERDADGAVWRVLLVVERAVTRTAGGFIVGEPKSDAGRRQVYVYGDAASVIADHLRVHVGRFGNPLLFPAAPRDGDAEERHLSQSTFHTPWWDDARKAAGRPDMPFHALRHRAGTLYAQHGATMQETMTRLGHSSTAVAMRYQHSTDRDAEIAARMAGLPASR
jgi:integrase